VLNPLTEKMVDSSSLTKIQLETLELHIAIHKSEIHMLEALKIRKNPAISRGTHYRILGQAKQNIKRSLFTIAIVVEMGLVKSEDVQKLISSVSKIPVDMDPEKLPEVLTLVKVLADRIVMS
jgi:hypothetical protein